jgi:hypothetical protein
MMRAMRRNLGLVAAFTAVGLLAVTGAARAGGCGGGGSYRGGGYGEGHTFGRTSYSGYGGGSCCAMPGMGMAGMSMGGMAMPAAQAPAAAMPGMDMGGYAAPAPAAAAPATAQPTATGAQYFCPMHPNVVSAGPAICPYCRMALQRR